MAGRTVKVAPSITVTENALDRAIATISPSWAFRRLKSRASLALAGSYYGASRSRRTMQSWNPLEGSPDTDILWDLPILRARSSDLERNNPIAAGAINTTVSNVLGSGLRLQSRINRDILEISDDEADAWERITESEWSLFFENKECDITRTLDGHAQAEIAFRQVLLNGDVFVNLPRLPRFGSPYWLKLQLIEADRVRNKGNAPDTEQLAGGISRSAATGEPIEYHVMRQHPGSMLAGRNAWTWDIIPARGPKTGLRNILHLYRPTRPGQSRGVPYLAPVIEPIKQLGRYTQAEIDAAVVASFFTVFIQTESGDSFLDITNTSSETGAKSGDKDMKLAPAAIIDLAKGEKIEVADPKRPNTSFDPFVMAVLRQIGAALELPFEVLVKHFQSSYSAARAALLDAWKFFGNWRIWMARDFYQSVYEIWMWEAVASGRIAAPGFLADPLIRMAYLGSQWIGPSPGQINPVHEVSAAEKRIGLGLSTRAEETAALTGGDFDQNVKQIRKEITILKEIGLTPSPSATTPEGRPSANTPPSAPEPGSPDEPEEGLPEGDPQQGGMQ